MTPGQIAQLQELSKCYMRRYDAINVFRLLRDKFYFGKLPRYVKKYINGLTHQYRHQIKAMKRNRVAR